MSWLARISCSSFILLMSLVNEAQVPLVGPGTSNLRQKTLSVLSDSMKIDTVSIISSSFSIVDIPSSDYHLDFVNAVLFWKKKPLTETITVKYRAFPFRLNPVAQHMSYDSVMNNFYVKPFEFNNRVPASDRGIFDFGTLKAEGSIGRQVGFGNRQDAVVNSSWNLQLSGMLSDSMEIQAAISDNNIPIQPDGTTQQLNEFDQVYMHVKKKNWQISLGDIDIRQNQQYFLNFYKRLQGVAFQTSNRLSKNIHSKSLLSGSIAKGKFQRHQVEAKEGNQGPYRLVGANNEIFFIVLANTERVFLDGLLLQRGEDQDYIINYNSAEITFTPRRMITKDSRVVVEFEYADRNYLNANLYLFQELDIGQKFKVRIGAFNNSDAKNSPINQVLDTKQQQFLAELGDSTNQAFYPAVAIDSFDVNKILYEKVFSGADSFYRYSTDPLRARYSLSFVDVKPGNGNYIPDANGANGKVYKYVPPIGGSRQGNFEPIQVLVTPKKQQLVSVGIDYFMNKTTIVKTEIATSSYDVNTFSSRHNGDDRGWAAKFQVNNEKMLQFRKKLVLNTALDYEFVQKKFKPLERLRNIEFSRDWGLPLLFRSADEHIFRASAGLRDYKNHSLAYSFTNYNRGDNYNGFQNSLLHNADWKGWQINNQLIVTNFYTATDKGVFTRPIIDISKQLKQLDNWRLGFKYLLEQNEVRNKQTDTLSPFAFSFDSYAVYLRSDESRKNKYGISFYTRSDKYPTFKTLLRSDRSLNLNLQAELLASPKRQFYINTTFRRLKVYNQVRPDLKDDETILGRVEYVMNEWKGLLTGNVLYEVGSGQEQRRDFAYLEVPAGTGQFAWIDYNVDGVQQLNEFEIAAFIDQAKFIRVLTPTNDFIKANFVTFNYSLHVSPRSLLNGPDLGGIEKLLSRINLVTSFQTSKKSIASGSFEFNPFKFGVNDTELITVATTILNTVSYNRYHSKWGIDLSNLRNNGKALLTYGFESRKLNEWQVRSRWNMSRAVSLTVNGRKGLIALYTPQFANRNYELALYSIEPFLTFIQGTSFRISTSYKWDRKKNLPLYGNERSISNSINIESKYNILQSSSVNGKFTFNNIDYSAIANTTVSYIMLDGLLPGKNFLWSLGFSKRLLNNLELNVTYDGRKAGSSRTVHIGRVAMTALF